MRLDELRAAIDAVDEKLVGLLNERAALALEIGRWKRARNRPLYDPKREAQVLRRVRNQTRRSGGPLDDLAVARVFERIIDEARQLEIADAEARGNHAGRENDGGRDGGARVGRAVAAGHRGTR